MELPADFLSLGRGSVIYVGFQSASIINYIEPLTREVFTAQFAYCHFDENIFLPLGGR